MYPIYLYGIRQLGAVEKEPGWDSAIYRGTLSDPWIIPTLQKVTDWSLGDDSFQDAFPTLLLQ